MRLTAAIILTGLILIITALASTPDGQGSCTCTSQDNSCNVNVTCPNGCLSFCPSNNCRAYCVKDRGEQPPDLMKLVTLRLNRSDSKSVAAELVRLSGAEIVVNPTRADAVFSLDVKNIPLWDVLDFLSADASIKLGDEDFSELRRARRAFLSGERMSVCFSNISAKRLADEISFLTGLEVNVPAGSAGVIVNYSGKGVTLKEIVTQVSEVSGVQIALR